VPVDFLAHLEAALAAHRAGKFADAQRGYELALRADPKSFAALHGFGVLEAQRGRFEPALRLIDRALAVRPDNVEALANRGNALRELGRSEEALASIDRALNLQPNYVEGLNSRGVALAALGRPDEALAAYDRALALSRSDFKALFNRGIALYSLGRSGEAVQSFDRALALAPNHADALDNRGLALQSLGRIEEALQSYDRALASDPGRAATLFNRGNALSALMRPEEALQSFDRALAIRPGYPEALNNRGVSLQDLGRPEEAVPSYDKALALRPQYAEAHFNRGMALKELARVEEARASFAAAHAIRPADASAHIGESQCLLLLGEFARGWELYEWRWRVPQEVPLTRDFEAPLWLGKESIAGKTILLHAEQGLGDAIQFCRYAPLVAERGAAVVIEVQPVLAALMASLKGPAQVVARGDPLPHFDLHCPLMSLPLAFGTRLDTVPAAVPYLAADAAQAAGWRARLAGFQGVKIGLVWAGSPRPRLRQASIVDRRRSLRLARLAPLAAVPGAVFVSLQKGDAAAEAAMPPADMTLLDWTAELQDFAATAALIEALDLVIGVDTAVIHAAGALGKPVWVLNRFDTDWRWLLDREDSPWYPTLRLFRQPGFGDWESVIARAAAELATWRPRD
jgi:tetratricopeptide (TPR) repeat protein